MDQTNYEMGSFESTPCSFKSPTVNTIEVVYTKAGAEFRANQVPTYGPVGINSCLGRWDRPHENYSMLKNYESLSLATKYCNMYQDCNIIVEIDRSRGEYNDKKLLNRLSLFANQFLVTGRSLNRLYEIGNTKSPQNHHCQPRPQDGVKVSRVNFKPSTFRQQSDIPAPVYMGPNYTNQGQG